MNRREILQSIFGDLSEEEAASTDEMNNQPEVNSDGQTEIENEVLSSQEEMDSGIQFNDDTRNSRSCDEAEHDKKCIAKQGIKTENDSDLNHEARSSWYCDGGATSENKIIVGQRVKSESGAGLNDEGAGLNNEARNSRLIQSERDKDQARIQAVMRLVFGDSDDDDEPSGNNCEADQGENYSISPEHKVNYEKDLASEDTVSYEDTGFVTEVEKAEDKLEGQSISKMLVLEIPQRTPHADPSQMRTTELPNIIIGFGNKPFDPTTYVEEYLYITDASGSQRLIPPTNIIQWRNVKYLDGKTSVETNARLVNWSDGSLQLLIGNEAFDLTEEDTNALLSHAYHWNEGIYQSLRRDSKSVNVASSSLVPDSNSPTALVDQGVVPETAGEQEQQGQADSLKQENNCNNVSSSNHNDVEDVNDEVPKDPKL